MRLSSFLTLSNVSKINKFPYIKGVCCHIYSVTGHFKYVTARHLSKRAYPLLVVCFFIYLYYNILIEVMKYGYNKCESK